MTSGQLLSNCRILVTRPRDQAGDLCAFLADEGAVPIAKPLIEIREPEDYSDLDNSLRQLSDFNWIIFASVNAVNAFLDRAEKLHIPLDFGCPRIAAIGKSTAAAIEGRGLTVEFVPSSFVAETFVKEFPLVGNELKGVRFLWPKTDIGRPFIYDAFTGAGAHVQRVICYTTHMPEDTEALAQQLRHLLERGMIDIVTFTSSQTVRNFASLIATVSPHPESVMSNVLVAVIGPETADTARKLLPRVHMVAHEHTISGLVDEMRRYAETHKLKFSPRKEVN